MNGLLLYRPWISLYVILLLLPTVVVVVVVLSTRRVASHRMLDGDTGYVPDSQSIVACAMHVRRETIKNEYHKTVQTSADFHSSL